ncbi:hypothetical protein FA15DRAFT_646096 [Coprinopsis marcescibilis]|uniref:Arrestin C-terminal-like domain-containing protein n=1 Tax=Coprinopsis marcescibilis TaxID=230819 RepID=A0A5C3KL66_COPMA|nr:hypothetical protein FA15DRAFT_646096 [Coprinopsis marcescibilis]
MVHVNMSPLNDHNLVRTSTGSDGYSSSTPASRAPSRPASPHPPNNNHELPPLPQPSSSPHMRFSLHQKNPSPKSSIDIHLDAPYLVLKGTGPDVESTRLSGNVVLFLAEATSIKEITLEFRGKARIPIPNSESLVSNITYLSYNICNHNWSFLDLGASSSSHKKHSHTQRTLKAGRHLFPFSLEIGGSLPSSINAPVLGGAIISYKLRATATRPGALLSSILPSLLHCTITVPLLRSFIPTALEYQQTLEIENTWAGKLMYNITLPHKAWAEGDIVGVLLKCSPLAKGVRVHSVLTNVEEKVQVYARSGKTEEKRIVACSRHEIVGGAGENADGEGAGKARAVLVEMGKTSCWIGYATPPTGSPSVASRAGSNASGVASGLGNVSGEESLRREVEEPTAGREEEEAIMVAPTDIVTTLFLPLPSSYTRPNVSLSSSGTQSAHHSNPASPFSASIPSTPFPSTYQNSNGHPCPYSQPPTYNAANNQNSQQTSHHHHYHPILPSHSVEPITISHRIRWSIFIVNPDGHISELRCALPIAIVDGKFRPEVRAYTAFMRRTVLGCGVVGYEEDGRGSGSGNGSGGAGGEGGFDDDLDIDELDGESDISDLEEAQLHDSQVPLQLDSLHHHHHQHQHPHSHSVHHHQRHLDPLNALELSADDRQLPSYHQHVRDRVANMYLPAGSTMRITNPWVVGGVSPVGVWGGESGLEGGSGGVDAAVNGGEGYGGDASAPAIASTTANGQGTMGVGSGGPSSEVGSGGGTRPPTPAHATHPLPPRSARASGYSTPHEGYLSIHALSSNPTRPVQPQHLAHLPGSGPSGGDSAPYLLDWVNSELLLSLSDEPLRRFGQGNASVGGGSGSGAVSPVGGASRAGSRPMSPVGEAQGVSSSAASSVSRHTGGSAYGEGRRERHGEREREKDKHGHGHHGALSGLLSFKGAMKKGFGFTKHHDQHHHHASGRSSPDPHALDGHGASGSGGGVDLNASTSRNGSRPGTGYSSAAASSFESVGIGLGASGRAGSGATTAPSSVGSANVPLPPLSASTSGMSTCTTSAGARSTSVSPAPGGKTRSTQTLPLPSHGARPTTTPRNYVPLPRSNSATNMPSSDSNGGLAPIVPYPYPRSQSPSVASPTLYSPLSPHGHHGHSNSMPTSPMSFSGHSPFHPLHPFHRPQTPQDVILHRAFTEVPDYEVAARGFIGGVAPLSSLVGLPSYEEVEREIRCGGGRGGVTGSRGGGGAVSGVNGVNMNGSAG